MGITMLLAAALAVQAEPPAQAAPRQRFIICPSHPRCPRAPRTDGSAANLQATRSFTLAREDVVPPASVGRVVYFVANTAALDGRGRAVLDTVAEWLARNPELVIYVEGHADARGSREANIALAGRRAEAVRDYLVERGVAGARLIAISYGEERPAFNDNGELMMNRRVELRFR